MGNSTSQDSTQQQTETKCLSQMNNTSCLQDNYECVSDYINVSNPNTIELETDPSIHPHMLTFHDSPCISSRSDYQKIYDLLNIPISSDKFVRIIDETEHYILVHYVFLHASVKHIRGWIIDIHNYTIVCRSFPYTEEYLSTDLPSNVLVGINENTKVYKSHDGTIIRLWYNTYDSKWMLSTHKRINGERSKWSGETFKNTFDRLVSLECINELDTTRCYVFMIQQVSNRLVCKINSDKLYYLMSYHLDNSQLIRDIELAPLPTTFTITPIEYITYESDGLKLCDIQKYIENMSWENYSGIMIEYNDNVCAKILIPQYHKYKELRGNDPNLTMTYLSLIHSSQLDEFKKLYNEERYVQLFTEIDDKLNRLPHKIRASYKIRYEQKRFLRVCAEEHYILVKTFEAVQNNNKLNPMDIIKDLLKTSNARQLNAMLKNL